jgi:hypothetical protein
MSIQSFPHLLKGVMTFISIRIFHENSLKLPWSSIRCCPSSIFVGYCHPKTCTLESPNFVNVVLLHHHCVEDPWMALLENYKICWKTWTINLPCSSRLLEVSHFIKSPTFNSFVFQASSYPLVFLIWVSSMTGIGILYMQTRLWGWNKIRSCCKCYLIICVFLLLLV